METRLDSTNIKILSFQPFSIYENGGGSRILRRLYEGHEDQVVSLALFMSKRQIFTGNIQETVVYSTVIHRPWMRWKLREIAKWLQNYAFRQITIKRLQKVVQTISYNIMHIVDHGAYSSALCDYSLKNCIQIWVSFHDHFHSVGSSASATKKLWINAERRLVISKELGEEYQRLFGKLSYEIITDGLKENELNASKQSVSQPIKIYFAGLLHFDYIPLFTTLFDSLNQLSTKGYSFELCMRGTPQITYPHNVLFKVIYKPVSLNNEELLSEMHTADILYLPITFTDESFYRFSLSTKLVGYLGAPGSILYHGPCDSAANQLLQQNKAAVSCCTVDASCLSKRITQVIEQLVYISSNAKILGKNQFDFLKINRKFWNHSEG